MLKHSIIHLRLFVSFDRSRFDICMIVEMREESSHRYPIEHAVYTEIVDAISIASNEQSDDELNDLNLGHQFLPFRWTEMEKIKGKMINDK